MTRVSRPATFLGPMLWALTVLTLLLVIVVVQRAAAPPWSFVLVVLPLGLAALSAWSLRRAVARPDDSV